jgi:hypothetical protein
MNPLHQKEKPKLSLFGSTVSLDKLVKASESYVVAGVFLCVCDCGATFLCVH